ncbi:solute carrier family 25 member 45 isoform X3 [Nasonia vitripennis]|uniref:Mitochondrial carrier protein n=1 Tax=Nasonia vitripennis TaxID=7425 RepID=A0A7M7HA83_NASVI|nr:solute carrier family 25 member 45 isoform X3 [Nasonia vitripennis]
MENFRHFIAGWGAGIFGVLIGHPMDTIKTHQQMCNHKLSTKDAVKLIIKRDGKLGLYKGMLFPLVCSGCLNSIYFGVYDIFLRHLQSLRGNSKVLPTNTGWLQDLFIAGIIGGTAQALITCPSELIKIKMQVGKGIADNDKVDIYRQNGIRGFFVGFVPTVWRDALGGGAYILSYQCTRHYMHGELNPSPGLFETLVAGGLAGIVSWIPVTPFDTIKSRMQADDFRNPTYKGMIDCSMILYRHASYHGFFKGFCMITVRSIPVNVSIIYGYELILWLCKHFDKSANMKRA